MKIETEGEGPCTDVMQVNRPDDLRDIADLGLTLAEAKRLLARVQQQIAAAQAKEHAVQRPECPRCDRACRVKDYRDHAVATLFGRVTVRLPRFRCAACGGIEAGLAWPLHCRSTPELDRLQAHLSCAEGERHLEVRVGNVETTSGGRQVFGAVAKAGTDILALISRTLDAVGRTKDTALTAFTDGCPGLRRILADAGVAEPPTLDWFHIAMRLQHLKQIANGLPADDPARSCSTRLRDGLPA